MSGPATGHRIGLGLLDASMVKAFSIVLSHPCLLWLQQATQPDVQKQSKHTGSVDWLQKLHMRGCCYSQCHG